jgi:hypothetical protein
VPADRGARRNSISNREPINTNHRAKPQAVERHCFAITHGRLTAGWVEQSGNDFVATIAPGRRSIGSFPSLKAAADAIDAAYGGAR